MFSSNENENEKDFGNYFLKNLEKIKWVTISEEEYEENKQDTNNYATMIGEKDNKKSFCKRLHKKGVN